MKNIVKFLKEKYKILIPIMVIIVLLVTIFFLYKEYIYDNTRNKEEVPVFQYFNTVREDYTGVFTYNLKKALIDVSAKDKKINFVSVPIYYKDLSKVVFTHEMSAVFPLIGGSQYKLYKYASFYKVDEVNFIKNNTEEGNYQHFFLYDGNGMYFFPDETILNIGGKKYKELGPMSYISLVGNTSLIYYDPSNDTSEIIELTTEKVTVTNEFLDVSIRETCFYSFDNKVLLFSPKYLSPLFKTIDK